MIGGGITNTLDLGGGQKIQDYLAGAGVSNQGPGGGTLYTQGQGINPRPVIDTSSQQYQDLFEKYRPGVDGVYSSGYGPVTQNQTYLKLPSMQDMTALGYYDPNPMTRVDKGPMMAEFMNNLYRQPASGDANLGFGSVQNPGGISAMEAGIAGMIPAAEPTPTISQQPIYAATGVDTTSEYSNLDILNPNYIPGSNPITPKGPTASTGQEFVFQKMFEDAGINPFANEPTSPITPQQQTGGFDSKAFANELLTGIGDLFKQHFPDSAQMAFNNSNQPQSQIEQPIQDATTFDVQPQQNTAYNPFSVNTIGGAFGGGY